MNRMLRFSGPVLHADVTGAVQAKWTERDRARSIQGGPVQHSFNIDVYGPGRVPDTLCTFRFAFVKQPEVSQGIALHVGDTILGRTPGVTATVHRWVRTDSGMFLAAYVQLLVTGHRRQRARATVTFSGTGIQLPIPGTAGSDADADFDFDAPLP